MRPLFKSTSKDADLMASLEMMNNLAADLPHNSNNNSNGGHQNTNSGGSTALKRSMTVQHRRPQASTTMVKTPTSDETKKPPLPKLSLGNSPVIASHSSHFRWEGLQFFPFSLPNHSLIWISSRRFLLTFQCLILQTEILWKPKFNFLLLLFVIISVIRPPLVRQPQDRDHPISCQTLTSKFWPPECIHPHLHHVRHQWQVVPHRIYRYITRPRQGPTDLKSYLSGKLHSPWNPKLMKKLLLYPPHH